MSQSPPSAPLSAPGSPKPAVKKGCLVWGCLGSIVFVFVAGGVLMFFAGKFRDLLEKLSEDEPREIPVYKPAPGELAKLRAKNDAFVERAEKDEGKSEIVLTADDLNAHILEESEGDSDGHLFVRIEEDRIFLDVSVPLDKLPPLVKLPGRYLNGTVELDAQIADGQVSVKFKSLTTPKGQEATEEVLEVMNTVFNEVRYDEQKRKKIEAGVGKIVKHAKSLEVREGKVILRN